MPISEVQRYAAMMRPRLRNPVLPVRAVERLLDPLMVRFEADHLTREPLDHLEPVGFRVEQVRRSKLGIVERVLAVKPS